MFSEDINFGRTFKIVPLIATFSFHQGEFKKDIYISLPGLWLINIYCFFTKKKKKQPQPENVCYFRV